jgi:hypothetical protein
MEKFDALVKAANDLYKEVRDDDDKGPSFLVSYETGDERYHMVGCSSITHNYSVIESLLTRLRETNPLGFGLVFIRLLTEFAGAVEATAEGSEGRTLQ